ncbi:MAG: class I SAM-dependent methyltransferase [Patescibacteria group bacterium]
MTDERTELANDFEIVPCLACGSFVKSKVFKNIDRLHNFPGVFEINHCGECGLIYVSPRPKNISQYYLQAYEPYNLDSQDFFQRLDSDLLAAYYEDKKGLKLWLKKTLYKIICQPIPLEYRGKKILDLGCGNGLFLYNLQKYGKFEVCGVEMSDFAAEQARTKLGLDVRTGTLANNVFLDNFFDIITLNHVLEHLPNPREILLELKRILKSGGVIMLTTPNAKSFLARIFGKYWFALETPRHLNIFSKKSILALIEKTEELEIVKADYQISNYVFVRSLVYFFNIKNKLLNSILMKVKVLFYPIFWLLPRDRRDFMTIQIKKK